MKKLLLLASTFVSIVYAVKDVSVGFIEIDRVYDTLKENASPENMTFLAMRPYFDAWIKEAELDLVHFYINSGLSMYISSKIDLTDDFIAWFNKNYKKQ